MGQEAKQGQRARKGKHNDEKTRGQEAGRHKGKQNERMTIETWAWKGRGETKGDREIGRKNKKK